MEKKKYQVRILRDRTNTGIGYDAKKFLGACKVTEIQTLYGSFESITDAFEKMKNIEELAKYEVISIILVDEHNREQIGEDYDWDDEE